MTAAPTPRLDASGSIAAILGVVLGGVLAALLMALIGVARVRVALGGRAREAELPSVLDAVWRAEADADMTLEPWVEWVAVSAPWRNGRLLPRRHAARRVRPCGVRPVARMRGPPVGFSDFRDERTGMA